MPVCATRNKPILLIFRYKAEPACPVINRAGAAACKATIKSKRTGAIIQYPEILSYHSPTLQNFPLRSVSGALVTRSFRQKQCRGRNSPQNIANHQDYRRLNTGLSHFGVMRCFRKTYSGILVEKIQPYFVFLNQTPFLAPAKQMKLTTTIAIHHHHHVIHKMSGGSML